MSQRLSVLLVGCGNIAGGYDPEPPVEQPLTHAGAFLRHGGFALAACVEPDAQRRVAFMRKWGVARGYESLAQVPATERFDVVSLCSPTSMHAQQLHAVLGSALRPRLIFCEKPVTPDLAQAEACVKACDEAGVLLAVNHTRRWAPDIARLREQLASGELGTLRSVAGLYNKGVLNNGSHMVDLLHFMVGPLRVAAALPPVDDALPGDPSVPALLQAGLQRVPVHLRTAHAGDYAVFELELVTSRGIFVMEEAGFAWRRRERTESSAFPGYQVLGPARSEAGQYRAAMTAAATNIHGALLRGEALRSTGDTALAAQRLCHELLTLARTTTTES